MGGGGGAREIFKWGKGRGVDTMKCFLYVIS